MCGIFGYVGNRRAEDIIIGGLKHLEYRGYDSAGLAAVDGDQLQVARSVGKLENLTALLAQEPLAGGYGIGHTRWATHGRPNETNAHPHADCNRRLMVAHNGIIENYHKLRERLTREGHRFDTDTDTEVIAHLIESLYEADLELAVKRAVEQLEGSYAFVAIGKDGEPGIVAARNGPPLVVGLGEGEAFVSSDLAALLAYAREIVFPDDGQVVSVRAAGASLVQADGTRLPCTPEHISWDAVTAEKQGFRHFMLKEIHEQPGSVRDTILGRVNLESEELHLGEAEPEPELWRKIRRVSLVACGTAWHACLAGKYYFEALAKIPAEVDTGSEFRYRDPLVDEGTLTVVVTQSGETADTLAALREAQSKNSRIMAVVNARGSLATREADHTLYLNAGPEVGVASTKAFTSMLVALYLLALRAGRARGALSEVEARPMLEHLVRIPHQMESLLQPELDVSGLVKKFSRSRHFLYLGRGVNYPIALEGALKLKEISYIHAEGYAAGEMKHGPIALVDEEMPVVAIATRSRVYEKMLSNMEEVKARGGILIAVSNHNDARVAQLADHVLEVPETTELLSPLLNVLPLQLLAYHIAEKRGCDVDQPRNLAKSVTVE